MCSTTDPDPDPDPDPDRIKKKIFILRSGEGEKGGGGPILTAWLPTQAKSVTKTIVRMNERARSTPDELRKTHTSLMKSKFFSSQKVTKAEAKEEHEGKSIAGHGVSSDFFILSSHCVHVHSYSSSLEC